MLDLLRLFVQVVEEQSFTIVARRLGISQPAVSNQMRALEEKLGVELLYRKGKSFSLTSQGEAVFRYAQRILDEWSGLLQEIGEQSAEISGMVHLGASHIPGEYLLPSALADFQKANPLVKFKITIGDSLEMAEKLLIQEVDFALVGSAFDSEKISSAYWLKDSLKLVLAEGHPLNWQEEIRVEDLKAYSMVLRESGSGHRRALEEALENRGCRVEEFPVGMEVGSTEAAKNAVRSGLGYSFLSQSALQNEHKYGLVIRDVVDFSVNRGFYLLTRRHKPLSSAAAACYSYLVGVGQKPDFGGGLECS